MLCDFIITDKNSKQPLYRQIYLSVRHSVENGSLKKGTKLPSIRRLSSDLSVSKTTVNAAYEQLCAEGYIKNKPQSGFFVEAQFDSKPKAVENSNADLSINKKHFVYDFSGKSIDEKIINISEWKKYVKDVLNQNYLLTSYGEPQGEMILREALQKYSLGTRSVNTVTKNIVVGAGTQPLLNILCSLIGINKTVAMAESGYVQSEFIFKSYGYKIQKFKSDKNGVTIDSLEKIKPDIVLVNPNFTDCSGNNMPVTRRLELIDWANKNNAYIIEDDYNGELRYSTHPMPCVQNYGSKNTVYLGSFSKVLLPSVRIGYMALPDSLSKKYSEISRYTNQTASKAEQIALAKYINNGKIDVHLRKARRVYLEKSKIMLENISSILKTNEYIFNETSLYVTLLLKDNTNTEQIKKQLEKHSVSCMQETQNNRISLSFSGISSDKIESGIKIVLETVY